MCLVSSSVKSSRSMRPILVTRVLKGLGAAEKGGHVAGDVTMMLQGCCEELLIGSLANRSASNGNNSVPQPRL